MFSLKMFWSILFPLELCISFEGDAADSETHGKMYLTSGRFKFISYSHPILHHIVWIALRVVGSLIIVKTPITSQSAE